MRLALVISALVLAAAGLVFFVLPAAVDQEAVQATLRRQVAELTGQRLTIEGRLEVRLLPSPAISIGRSTLRPVAPEVEGGGSGPIGEIDRIDLAVDLPGLLKGEPVIEEARIVRPRLRFETSAMDALSQLSRSLLEEAPELSVERVNFTDGSLVLAEPEGSEVIALDIRGDVAVDAESGTRRIEVSANVEGRDWRLTGTVARPRSGRATPMDLGLSGEGIDVHVAGRGSAGDSWPEVSGTLRLEATDVASIGELFNDDVFATTLTQTLTQIASGPFEIEGDLVMAESSIELSDVRTSGALNATLNLRRDFGDAALLDLDLSFEALRSGATGTALDAAGRLVTLLPRDLAAKIGVNVDELEIGGLEIRRFAGAATLDGRGGGELESLHMLLPGSGELELTGRLVLEEAGTSFEGMLIAASQDLESVGRGLAAGGEPLLPVPFGGGSIEAVLAWSPRRIALRDMRLQVDGTKVEGGIVHAAGERRQVAASLRIDRLDLDELVTDENLSALLVLSGEIDHALDIAVERVSWGRHRLRGLSVKTQARDGGIIVEEVAVGDFLDGTARLTGVFDGDLSVIDLTAEADLGSAGRVMRELGLDTGVLATLLGPVRLDATLEGSADKARLKVGLDGETFTGSLDGEGNPAAFEAAMHLEASDSGQLLRQLGGLVLDHPSMAGEARLTAELEVPEDGRSSGRLDLELGSVRLDGSMKPDDELGSIAVVQGRGIDAELARSLYIWLTPALGLLPGPPGNWLGAWPDTPIVWQWPSGEPLALRSRWLDNDGAPLAEIDAILSENMVSVDRLSLPMGEGLLEVQGRMADDMFVGTAEAENVPVDRLLLALGAGRGMEGQLDASLSFSASARSVRDAVLTVEGTGELALKNGSLATDGAPLPFEQLAGRVVVERGVASLEDLALIGADGSAPIDAKLDLGAWILDARLATVPPRRAFGPLGRLVFLDPARSE